MKIGIFAGAFKPPHLGHFKVAQDSCRQNDQTHILISLAERDGFDANLSRKLWNIYKPALKGLKICVTENSPIRTAYLLVEELGKSKKAPSTIVYLYCSDEDMSRYDRIYDYIGKLKGLYRIPTSRIMSASAARGSILMGRLELALHQYFPGKSEGVSSLKIYNALRKSIHQGVREGTMRLSNTNK